MRIAHEMAVRHNIQIAGFESAGIAASTVEEISRAVDMVLTKYRIELHGIEITELGGQVSRAESRSHAGASEAVPPEAPELWIVLDSHAAADPAQLRSGQAQASTRWIDRAGPQRPITVTMLREFGHIADLMGKCRARPTAQRALITEYLRANGGDETLARVVSGYRGWRGQLSDYCFDRGVLDPGRGLAEGFAAVELYGGAASAPAKALHRLLIGVARVDTR
ncbi:hypothetical protein DFR68_113108 [Nocardia mexicana]|uniref:Uncharacterized protein n=2 Tax=Nocardia mexicana TaxID=279262 RepID=A0A370GNU6_9NOCA|nr:hypothetical protein DFR68_113108 [Nocardia mexicana]